MCVFQLKLQLSNTHSFFRLASIFPTPGIKNQQSVFILHHFQSILIVQHFPLVLIDDRLQNEGADMFWHFNKRIGQVDTELQNFANAVRPLGSSVGLISSSYNLRARLQQVLYLFRENASNTFKDKVTSDPPEPLRPFSSRKKSKTRRQRPTHTLRPNAPLEKDLESFPQQLELLSKDLVSFLHFLHDIPEFTDEGLNGVVLSFEADLKYWASCLKEFDGMLLL